MKKFVLFLAAVFAGAAAAKAATVETMSAELEKAGFTVTVGVPQAPKPGVPQPVHNTHPPKPDHPTHPSHPAHPTHPSNPGHPAYPPQQPGHPTQPWNPQQPGYPTYPPPQPGYPTYPWDPGNQVYPPVYPPQYPPQYPPYQQLERFSFESGSFVFGSDADASRESAVASLRRAGYTVLEQRDNFTRYTLVFLAPSYLKVERYESGSFVFASDAKQAADECVRAMEARGSVVLEKNVQGTRFTVSYLSSYWQGQPQQQTYNSGSFVFASDARESMEFAAEALRKLGAVIVEKRQNGTSYTIVFRGDYRLEFRTFESGAYTFASDAREGLDQAASALQRARGTAVVEKRQNGTRFTVVFVSRGRVEFQRYESGAYTFASDARQAANESAAAFASQGFVVLEKNVQGTRFTIVYFQPGYYY